MKVSIGQAAKELGVSQETLRRWEAAGARAGEIEVERTPNGHRRYDLAKLHGIGPRLPAPAYAGASRPTVAYARSGSHDQRDDLTRQVALLETFCAANGWSYEVIQDFGSGLNYHKRGLQQLIKRIGAGEVGRLVLTHKDRLLRFGSKIIFSLCKLTHTEVVIINQGQPPASLGRDLNAALNLAAWTTASSAESYACGESISPGLQAVLDEAGTERRST